VNARSEHSIEFVGDCDEERTRRRLLQQFQQCVRGRPVERFGRIEQDDAPAAAMRCEREELRDLAHLIDQDRAALCFFCVDDAIRFVCDVAVIARRTVGRRHEPAQVRVIVGAEE